MDWHSITFIYHREQMCGFKKTHILLELGFSHVSTMYNTLNDIIVELSKALQNLKDRAILILDSCVYVKA